VVACGKQDDTVTIQQAFDIALQHHQSGRLADAEAIYRQILAVEPCNADALHLLGVIAHQVGRNDVAADLIQRAITLNPNYAAAYANLGEVHRKVGRPDDALPLLRRALALQPGNADAHNILGNTFADLGRDGEALAAFEQAIRFYPSGAEAHYNLGNTLSRLDRAEEALAAYRRAIQCRPGFAEAHYNLGNTLNKLGRIEEALAAYRSAIQLSPSCAVAHYNHGNMASDLGRTDEAVASYRDAVRSNPFHAEAHYNLGNMLDKLGLEDEAGEAFRQAVQLDPGLADAQNNLANFLKKRGHLDEAIAGYQRALRLQPELVEARTNLAATLTLLGCFEEAVTACQEAIRIKPGDAAAYGHLGSALKGMCQMGEAVAAYQRALEIKPDHADAHNNLGVALKDMGRAEEAIVSYRRALELQPEAAGIRSNVAFTMHYPPEADAAAEAVFAEHLEWARIHASPLEKDAALHSNDRSAGRRLRVGYVSPDFRVHSVAYFIENLLAGHDPSQVEVFCYADIIREDSVSARLRSYAVHWRRITGLGDERVARLVREDAIDILVDLAGHTSGNRLPVFARRPAPVQVTAIGYCGTTGLSAIDFRLTDALADPPGATEHLHTERLVRLPRAWCFRPPEDAPPVAELPAGRAGHATFGCFNARPKMNASTFALWARILEAVPGSRLMLKNGALRDSSVQIEIRDFFSGAGIHPERIELLGWLPSAREHLAAYERVDVALDTFPYHGTATTCEALWMGVPVVTMAGKVHASRVGVSLLTNVGLPELIAQTPGEYVQVAAGLAADLHSLAALRQSLRERMRASALSDAHRFARDVEAAYRAMWGMWCSERNPSLP